MNKLRVAGLTGVLLVAAAEPAWTQTRPGFALGGEAFDYAYRERFEGETIVRDDGEFIGLTASYVETIGNRMFLRARLNTGFGRVDYRSNAGARLKNVSQDIGQLELQIGRDFRVGERATLTPFVGLASRVLDDRGGGKQSADGTRGYDREIAYDYVPVGLAAGCPVGGRLNLLVSAQYNWVVSGAAKSKFSKVDPEFPDIEVDLNEGHGFEASATLSVPVGRHALGFGPFVRHWNIKRSESVTFSDEESIATFFEPKNRTTEAGLRLTFAF